MKVQQNEGFRILGRESAHEHSFEELSAAELAEVSGAGCNASATVKTTSGGGKPDDREITGDITCTF